MSTTPEGINAEAIEAGRRKAAEAMAGATREEHRDDEEISYQQPAVESRRPDIPGPSETEVEDRVRPERVGRGVPEWARKYGPTPSGEARHRVMDRAKDHGIPEWDISQWLKAPNAFFDGLTPNEVIDSGNAHLVMDVIPSGVSRETMFDS